MGVGASNSPTIYNPPSTPQSRPNTGNIPFQLGPVYIDYSGWDRLGSMHFDIF